MRGRGSLRGRLGWYKHFGVLVVPGIFSGGSAHLIGGLPTVSAFICMDFASNLKVPGHGL
jgi:hypothetical protein